MIVVIDYGRGNLYSLSRALGHVGAVHTVTDAPDALNTADEIVLPGVGAFADTMAALHERRLVEPIQTAVARGIPLLGICLGMQVLATAGEEFGRHAGLGLVPGVVRLLPRPTAGDPGGVRIPNVGWRGLEARRADPLTEGLPDNAMMYFVHSFGMFPSTDDDVIATVPINGIDVPAIVRRGAVTGCQFHPERSGETGLALLANFVNLVAGKRPELAAYSIGET